jgi:hypothetical protein
MAFWEDWKLKPELLYQTAPGKAGLIYSLAAESQITWPNGFLTKGIARYIGFHAIDSGARSSYSFSNVFAGEILRLDAIDAPFLQIGIKQSFPGIKTSLKLQMAQQIGQPKLSDWEIAQNRSGKRFKEYDATLSKTFGEHVLMNLTGGFVDFYYLELPVFPSTTDYYYGKAELFGKLELRLTL